MVPWHFDLSSRQGLADFIEYHAIFLPSSHVHANQLRLDEHQVESLRRQGLLNVARQIGRETWPTRQALRTFLEGEGTMKEREALLDAVRPTTAVLLARLIKRYPEAGVTTLLTSPEATFAFHEAEEAEIRLLRPELWVDMWQKYRPSFAALEHEFEKEAQRFSQRLEEERTALADHADSIIDEKHALLQELEDRVFLKGERVALEVMETL